MDSDVSRENLHFVGFAHICLFIANALPLLLPIPTEYIIVYAAVLSVYIGSWRSVKTGPPEESMTKKARRLHFLLKRAKTKLRVISRTP